MLAECKCVIKTCSKNTPYRHFSGQKKKKTAGAIIVDRGSRSILLVKSYNNGPWGFPKGSAEEGETAEVTAQRELLEETGFDVDISEFTQPKRIGKGKYFLFESERDELPDPLCLHGDISGIGWFAFGCSCIRNISLNSDARKFFNK